MLRPERMSRVSVTGSKPVMNDVIEAVYEIHLLDLSSYDGSWQGFEPGDPLEGADDASNDLVTVRSLKSILGVEGDQREDLDRNLDEDALAEEIEDLRQETNALDDRREELDNREERIDERLRTAESLRELGIDLDLLWGYDSLAVRVGEADPDAVASALEGSEDVESFETFSADGIVAVFARPAADGENPLENALVSVRFDPIEIPEEEGEPDAYVERLRERKREIADERDGVEDDLDDLAREAGGFLLAAEEKLTIDVQKREAPLTFATTRNAFVAEGWIPTNRLVDLAEALETSVGNHVEFEELERASYNGEGRATGREPTEGSIGDPEAVTDGGTTERSESEEADVPMMDREPPVVQQNPGPVKPFETLVRTVNRPKYTEIDPTVILFLTFPLMFGFMIGDVGYGAVYTAVGYGLYRSSDNDAITSLGAIAIWGGVLTMTFGFLYGEVFGYKLIAHGFWEAVVGLPHAPIEKGLYPGAIAYAELWIVMSVLFGIAHMTIGYLFDFVDNLSAGITTAVLESGSWLTLMLGVWVWIFSRTARGSKPELLFTVFSGNPIPLGFGGFSATVGWAGLAIGLVVGLVLVIANEITHFGGIGVVVGIFESLRVVVNALSYTRLAAEVLAEVGLAFAVNLLFFGAYESGGEFHYLIGHGPEYVQTVEGASLMFPGLVHAGILGVAFGAVVLVVGHILVLGIGVMSAGLQAVRLEYVEFFNQFYEGGGDEYEPFGYERAALSER